MRVILKLLQGVDLFLHLWVECHKEVLPQLVEQTKVSSGLEITFEQKWVVAYEHVHEAPRPETNFVYGYVFVLVVR